MNHIVPILESFLEYPYCQDADGVVFSTGEARKHDLRFTSMLYVSLCSAMKYHIIEIIKNIVWMVGR